MRTSESPPPAAERLAPDRFGDADGARPSGASVLLATGFGDDDTGGGLYALEPGGFQAVDRLSSTGLWSDGERLIRLLRAPDPGASVGEILVYDHRGVAAYLRVDELRDPHDVLVEGGRLVAASPLRNELLWIGFDGRIERTWRAPGEGDAWHLNGLLLHDGRLLVSAFGRHLSHRAWQADLAQRSGFVFDAATGENVLRGLVCPHTPRFLDGRWTICNSGLRELLQLDEAGSPVRRVALEGWTRGLAAGADVLYVGESADRADGPAARASVAAVDRRTFRVLERWTLPCREVYDLVLVPPALTEGARTGFRTNADRVAEGAQHALFDAAGVEPARLWATGDALPAEACRVRLEADPPAELRPGELRELACTVENRGSAILVSAPPHPVHVSYRWFPLETAGGASGAGQAILPQGAASGALDGLRTRLPAALPPHGRCRVRVPLLAPEEPGAWELRLTAVQEQVAWFDDLDPASGLRRRVDVAAGSGRAPADGSGCGPAGGSERSAADGPQPAPASVPALPRGEVA